MARPITTLAIFFIAFNVFAGALTASGVAGTLGLDANVGGDAAVDKAEQEGSELQTGNGLGSTLFGMYNVLAKGLSDLVSVVFPGLSMLRRVGIPGYITSGVLAPLFTFVTVIGFMSFVRGWGL